MLIACSGLDVVSCGSVVGWAREVVVCVSVVGCGRDIAGVAMWCSGRLSVAGSESGRVLTAVFRGSVTCGRVVVCGSDNCVVRLNVVK